MKNDRAVLKQAIETYGAEAQLNVAIEEFSELTKEICKHNWKACRNILESMNHDLKGKKITICSTCEKFTPTTDVVEVVRCKDCKRCYEKRTNRNNQLMRFCMRMDGNEYQVNANDFCSYGTLKERGGEK